MQAKKTPHMRTPAITRKRLGEGILALRQYQKRNPTKCGEWGDYKDEAAACQALADGIIDQIRRIAARKK